MEEEKYIHDLEMLCNFAIKNGATKARVVDSGKVVVDERVQLKCRYPPCVCYGKNLMCPPYALNAKEFRESVRKYKKAIIVQIQAPINEEIKKRIKEKDARLEKLWMEDKIIEETGSMEGWQILHNLICAIERRAFNEGYYLSLGLVAGGCRLCSPCELKWPCKHPGEARPSMEALGIDVYKTLKNTGLDLKWNTKDFMTLTGIVLID